MKHLEEIVEKLKGELESSDQVRVGALLRELLSLLQRNVLTEATLVTFPCGHILREARGSCQSCFSLMRAIYNLRGLRQHGPV